MCCCGSDTEANKIEGVANDETSKAGTCCSIRCNCCSKFLTKFKENKVFRQVTIVVVAIAGILLLTKVLKKKK